MSWIVDINIEVLFHTATKKADWQSGEVILFYQTEKHRHRKSIVLRIVRSRICPFKSGAQSLEIHTKFTLRGFK